MQSSAIRCRIDDVDADERERAGKERKEAVHPTLRRASLILIGLLFLGCVESDERRPDLADLRDPWTLSAVPQDSVLSAGQRIFDSCASCHLADAGGRPDGTIPRLAGQNSMILERRLSALLDDSTNLPVMKPFARALTRIEIGQVSAYLSSLPRPAQVGLGSGERVARGEEIYGELCLGCHATNGLGQSELNAPRLCGQHAAYSLRRLNELADSGPRMSDPAMSLIAGVLAPQDRRAVSDYLSRLDCD
jgi:cytochrome c553